MEFKTMEDQIYAILYDQKRYHPQPEIRYIVNYSNGQKGVIEKEYRNNPGEFESVEAEHPNVDHLVRYYSTMPDEYWKREFVEHLKSKIDKEFASLKYLFLEFLVRIGQIDKIISMWEYFSEHPSLVKLGSLVYFEPDCFPPEHIEQIKDKIQKDVAPGWKDQRIWEEIKILNLIMAMKHHSLSRQLHERENPEINFDVERIREKVESFGFPSELDLLLTEIQEGYERANKDADFNAVLDKTRKLLDQQIEQISDRVSNLKQEPISNREYPLPYERRKFLLERGLIKEEEKKLLDILYSITSSTGTHSLKASGESARIYKNIIIEVILYLLERLYEFEKEIQNTL